MWIGNPRLVYRHDKILTRKLRGGFFSDSSPIEVEKTVVRFGNLGGILTETFISQEGLVHHANRLF